MTPPRRPVPSPSLALALLLLALPALTAVAAPPPEGGEGAPAETAGEEPGGESAAALAGDEEATFPLPAAALGLRKGSLLEVPVPAAVQPNTAFPGEGSSLPRAYPGAPPQVSHGIADMLPITPDANLCADCHDIEEGGEGLPTPIPASHRTDLRRSPGQVGERIVGSRWLCVTCHVPATGAEPLVGNSFDAP